MRSPTRIRPRRGRQRLTALALGLVLAAVLGAVAFRVAPGLRQRLPTNRVITTDGIGIWKTDPVYGYRHVPGAEGQHSFPGSFEVAYTIDDSGSRVTPEPRAEAAGRVLVLGCSYTFGHGVEDTEAWPWQLGEARPDIKVVNKAVMGWSTVHALLTLEAELERDPPDLVLYGWIPQHRGRNYIRHTWVSVISKWGRLHPHMELGPNGLEHRGVVDLSGAVPADAAGLDETEERLTLAMLEQMRALSLDAGARFVLVRLRKPAPKQKQFDRALKGAAGEVVDLTQVDGGQLPGDGHPDADWHANVAHELTPLLDETFRR